MRFAYRGDDIFGDVLTARSVTAMSSANCLPKALGGTLLVEEMQGWTCPHALTPGQEIPSMQKERLFAVRDGFVALINYKDMP